MGEIEKKITIGTIHNCQRLNEAAKHILLGEWQWKINVDFVHAL